MAMTDPISAFLDHMRSVGCAPFDASIVIGDDKRRRFRIDTDRAKTSNGCYSLKVEPDGFAFGWCKNWKEGVTHSWHIKTDRKASADDRAAWKAKAVLAKQAREKSEADSYAAAAVKAKGIWARCDKTGQSGYLERKGCDANGARFRSGALVVPAYRDGVITSLQFIAPDGVKKFMTDGAMTGAYFPMATKGEAITRLVICEGFATGAKIREATGLPVVCAFNAGNLVPVAKAMRLKYPDAEIVIGADNDQWTEVNGKPVNPGMTWAQQAAAAIGGCRVIAPQVPPDDHDRRTDWDDIARSNGLDAVREAFAAQEYPDLQDREEWVPPDYDVPETIPQRETMPFRCLGQRDGNFYFLPSANGGEIVELTSSALGKMSGLMRIHSSHDYWQQAFGGPKMTDSQIANAAMFALGDICHRNQTFRLESVRGVGAWQEDCGIVVNDGRRLITPKGSVPIYQWTGDTTYVSDALTFDYDAAPLGNAEAVKLRELCAMLQWSNPLLGDLFAGWLVIAPFAACLRWRPHGWLSGASGSGKSWVIDNIVRPVLGKSGLIFEKQTEAGIRKRIGRSGKPFVLDEAEAETIDQRENLQKIMQLMRAASSGGTAGNAVESYTMRSAFLLSSIGVSATHTADTNRITQFTLRSDRRSDAGERFARVTQMQIDTITPEWVAGLQARTMQNLDTLYANEGTFRVAAAKLFGKQRNADQLAPMIAGLYMLTSTGIISPEKAVEWLRARDWSWHVSTDEDSDAYRFIQHLLSTRARYDAQGIAREQSLGRMVEIAALPDHVSNPDVVSGLKALGLKVEDGWLWIANSSPGIAALMKSSSWATWSRTLSDYPGADNFDNKAVWFCAGLTSKVKRIPIESILRDPSLIDAEIPFEEDSPW